METTRDTFFKPGKVSAADKAERTDSTARQILAAELKAREKKTEALRALRLAREQESETSLPVASAKPARKSKR